MLILAIAFFSLGLISAFSFYKKYEARLRFESVNAMRYSRIADYYGRPILLAFEYRLNETDAPALVEADVDEIYHYGRDYFLKGRSPDRKRSQIFKWSRVSNPRVRYDGRNLVSLEELFMAAEGGPQAAA
jgi:hypothetical protein